MTSLVVLFSYLLKLNMSKSKAITKILLKNLCCDLTDLSNAIKKLWEKISFHKHFKLFLGSRGTISQQLNTVEFYLHETTTKCQPNLRLLVL